MAEIPDLLEALRQSFAEARRRREPHPFHMNSYVGSEPRCWCGKFASDPIHSGEDDRG